MTNTATSRERLAKLVDPEAWSQTGSFCSEEDTERRVKSLRRAQAIIATGWMLPTPETGDQKTAESIARNVYTARGYRHKELSRQIAAALSAARAEGRAAHDARQPEIDALRRERDELVKALKDARRRLRGEGMLGGYDDPVRVAIAKTESHTHVAGTLTGKDIDTCSLCGHDLRHDIHLRATLPRVQEGQ